MLFNKQATETFAFARYHIVLVEIPRTRFAVDMPKFQVILIIGPIGPRQFSYAEKTSASASCIKLIFT